VDDGRLAVVQPRHRLANITEDLQHLELTEARLQVLVHHLQHVRPAVRHQDQHLVHPVARVRDARVHEAYYVFVPAQVALQNSNYNNLIKCVIFCAKKNN